MHLHVRFALIALAVGFHKPAQADTGWRLVWSDEFDYTGLPDSSRWSYDVGGHGYLQQGSEVSHPRLTGGAQKQQLGEIKFGIYLLNCLYNINKNTTSKIIFI